MAHMCLEQTTTTHTKNVPFISLGSFEGERAMFQRDRKRDIIRWRDPRDIIP
jgi:hypothetical protein